MRETIDIIITLQNTNSKKEKLKILEENKENEMLKNILKFSFDDNITTGISNKKLNKNLDILPTQRFYNFKEISDYIIENNTGKDEDIKIVQCFIQNAPIEDKIFWQQVFTKKLSIGMSSKSLNKVYGNNFIDTFEVQNGIGIENVKLKGDEKIFISQKLNGCRCISIDKTLKTRQNKEYTNLEHIMNDIIKIKLDNMVLDGELIYKNPEGLNDTDCHQKGKGIATSDNLDKTSLKYVIFDILSTEEFYNGKSKAKYSERKQTLLMIQNMIDKFHIENLEIVPMFYEGYNHNEINTWLEYAEETDMEGVMINLDTPYECKRSKKLIKVKKFKSCDLKVLRIEKGEVNGKYENTLGRIICNYKGFELGVGSGFNDEERNLYYNNPELIIGKIVEVKYKEETKDKKGNISVQFPVFQGIRLDKNEESYE